jgi:hypothetical protein
VPSGALGHAAGEARTGPQLGEELGKVRALAARSDWAALDRRLAELPLTDAPADVRNCLGAARTEARQLRDLALLETVLSQRWPKAPEVADLEAHLTALLDATKDPALVQRVGLDLAARAEAEGHVAVARRLRDFKLVAGPAEVRNPAPPDAGVKLPVPEAEGTGVRPAPKEAVREGLPRLKPEAAAGASKAGVQEELREHAGTLRANLTLHLQQAGNLTHTLRGPERGTATRQDADDRYEAEVKGALGRELTASERVLARQMRQQGKSPAACAEVLRDLASDR